MSKHFNETHGESGSRRTPEYTTWCSIKARCFNTSSAYYHRYGGRGITMCAGWRESYEAFLSHAGRRPSPLHTIERIENDKGYKPGNVRWATRKEQARNRTSSRLVTLNGVTKTAAAWAEELGVAQGTLRERLRNGWSIKRALSASPAPMRGQKDTDYEVNGVIRTLREWSILTGIRCDTILSRIRYGWKPIEVISLRPKNDKWRRRA